MKAGKLAYGTDMCLEKIKFNKAKLVILAEDTASNTKEKIIRACDEKSVKYLEYGQKEEISYCIGKANKTVVAILDGNFAKSINKMIDDLKGAIC